MITTKVRHQKSLRTYGTHTATIHLRVVKWFK